MKNTSLSLTTALVALFLIATGCNNTDLSGSSASLDSSTDSVSYSLGFLTGSSMSESMNIEEFNYENFAIGLRDAMEESDTQMSEEDMMTVFQNFQFEMQSRMAADMAAEAEVNREEAEAFLAENAENDGVMTTDSGLQYRVIEEGDGEQPEATDTVEVHYRGSLLNGEEFDSSYSRGEPVSFPLNNVIPGWSEGVQLMRVGATYEFFLPPNLAYGETPPQGSPIPAGAALIFEVELLDIVE